MNQHPEIIAAPYTVWTAPVGTAFPAVDEAPAEAWTLLGSNGDRSYSGGGVTVAQARQYASSTPAAATGSSTSWIEGDGIRVRVELLDLTLEQYAVVLGQNAVAVTPAAPGIAGVKTIGLAVRTGRAAEFAVLARGPSPYADGMAAQYELPRCTEVGNPQAVFRKGVPAGLAVELMALEDPLATSEETRFGRLVAQSELALAPVFMMAPFISGDAIAGGTLSGEIGVIEGGTVVSEQLLRLGDPDEVVSNPYLLGAPDVGESFVFQVTAAGPGGETVATSAAVGPVIAAPFTAIAADGWQATVASPIDLSLEPFSIRRAGYNSSAIETTLTETGLLTKRVRQVFPNEELLTADQVALNEYIMAADTVIGATNSSALVSPKPVAAWVMPARQFVAGSVAWEIVAFHWAARDGKQVACVRVRGNDGTTQTAWQVVSTTAISTLCEDRNPVEVYAGTLDVSALADGLIWLEAEVYPHVGTAASVLSTADTAAEEDFSPRYYLKETVRATPYAYVSTTGNDGTGVWSATPATAKASPFATWVGAFNAIYAAGSTAVTANIADGCRIRMMAGTHVLTSPSAALKRPQLAAAVTTERDPDSARSACIVTFGLAAFRPNVGIAADGLAPSLLAPLDEAAFQFFDITINRTGAQAIQSTSSGGILADLHVIFHNVVFDNASQTLSWLSSTASSDAAYGLEVTNIAGNAVLAGVSQRRMWRGLKVDLVDLRAMNGYRIIGSELDRFASVTLLDAQKGTILCSTKFLRQKFPYNINTASAGQTFAGIAVVQNLFEFIGALTGGVAQPALAISANTGSTSHTVIHHNTITGYANEGRANLFYDNFSNLGNQVHPFASVKGNLFSQPNLKGDWFNSDAADTGNFAVHHGVGHAGNFAQFHANVTADESESWAYFGVGSLINTGAGSDQTRNDPLFTDYEGTTGTAGTATVGVGDGTYTLQGGSPARDILSGPLLGFDLAGAARGTGTQDAGAYA